jgi:hypothetical protein
MIDLKNPAPFAMLPEYPISTGLADFFEVLRKQPSGKVQPELALSRPKPTMIRR